jgi:hypothetical protein
MHQANSPRSNMVFNAPLLGQEDGLVFPMQSNQSVLAHDPFKKMHGCSDDFTY